MVRRSVEIHLLPYVTEHKLENRDTCVYIRRNSRVRRNWFVRDYPLKKNVADWEIDLRPSARCESDRIRRTSLHGPDRRPISSRADNGKRIFDVSSALLGDPRCLMQTRAARSLVRPGLNDHFCIKVGKSVTRIVCNCKLAVTKI